VSGRLRAFGAFWYDFVVGDDWRIAVAVIVALGATALLAALTSAAWALLPVVVVAVLTLSLVNVVRAGRTE
jgi:hypothetical protein